MNWTIAQHSNSHENRMDFANVKVINREANHDKMLLFEGTRLHGDFHTEFGCCLHYTTIIRNATQSKNHSVWRTFMKSNSVSAGVMYTGQFGTLRYKIAFGARVCFNVDVFIFSLLQCCIAVVSFALRG
jgi:hypothetical protein